MYNNASEQCNEYLQIYFNQYTTLSDAKKGNLVDKYDPEYLFFEDMTKMCSQKTKKNQLIKNNL